MGSWYVVTNGRSTRVFPSWEACANEVLGFLGAVYKKYKTREEALVAFYHQNNQNHKDKVEENPVLAVKNKATCQCANVIICFQAIVIVFLIWKLM
jgi:viroplasmin and RNaseH domain-containing protein